MSNKYKELEEYKIIKDEYKSILLDWNSKVDKDGNIENLCRNLGLKIKYLTTYGMGDMGELKGNTIFVNALNTEGRQRFTIAHELAHFVLGHGDRKRDGEKISFEFEANKFAATLLMPEKIVKKIILEALNKSPNTELTDEDIKYFNKNPLERDNLINSISTKLKVSKLATEIRLSYLLGMF